MGILRLLLAISVVIAHSSPIWGLKLLDAKIAVQAFYIISGFYMAMILTTKYKGQDDYWLFLSNRLLRLLPTYWLILLATVSVSVFSYVFLDFAPIIDRISVLWEDSAFNVFFFIFISNILIIGQDMMLFFAIDINHQLYFTPHFASENLPLARFILVPQAWTLSLEILFYLLAPFLVKRNNVTLCLVAVLSLFIRISLTHLGYNHDPWNYRFFPNELLFFIGGILSYRLKNSINVKYAMVMFLFVIGFTVVYKYIPGSYTSLIYLTSIFVGIPFIFQATQKNNWDRIIGEYSFPVYISHVLIIRIGTLIFQKFKLSNDYLSLFAIIFSLIASYFIIRFVIQPIESIRQKRINSLTIATIE
jgi:peptidoglycan/LPS O-acetylase OafA/YrhL